jgi:hypothetical protein
MNRHNSRQGYNLDELNNQSESTRGLAPHKEVGVIRKLGRIVMSVFRSEIAMVGQGVLWFQNKDKLIKVMIGLMKQMREAT